MFAKHQSHLEAMREEYVKYLRVDVMHVCLVTDLGHWLVFECLVNEESRNYINKKIHCACYYVRNLRHVGAVTESGIGESTTGTYVCFVQSRFCTLWMHRSVPAEALVRLPG